MKERDLWERVRLANKQDGDVYISIHVNSFPQSIWSGAQTFYQEGEEESKRLAVAVQTQLALRLGPNRRKAKAADYRVLRSTKMPAVIVEVGFISNPGRSSYLASRSIGRSWRRPSSMVWWIICVRARRRRCKAGTGGPCLPGGTAKAVGAGTGAAVFCGSQQ